MLFFLLSKLRGLAIAHQRLRPVARHRQPDRLLNRGAFTREVDEALADAQRLPQDGSGAPC